MKRILFGADRDQLSAARQNSVVRWTGDWHREYRLGTLLGDKQDSTVVRMNATFVDDGNLQKIEDAIAAAGGKVTERNTYQRVNKRLIVEVWDFLLPRNQVDLLLNEPTLIFVSEIPQETFFDELSAQVMADNNGSGNTLAPGYQAWLAETGYDGTGVKVAIDDSGVDWDHPELNVVSGTEYNAAWAEAGEPGSDGGNGSGHGSHVAGIVAGTGSTGATDANGYLVGLGVAPGATIHAQDGVASGTAVATRMKDSYESGAALSQNSWGNANPFYTGAYIFWADDYDMGTLDADPATEEMQSMLYVFAAGNDGGNGGCPGGQPCLPSIGSPAVGKNVLAVGSTDTLRPAGDDNATNQQLDDVTWFSSRGNAQDGRIKPDVMAPGSNIISARNTAPSTFCVNAFFGAQHAFCSGTSMATPHVSGVAALFTQMWREPYGRPALQCPTRR